MKTISEQEVINNGLNYVRTLDEFKIHGNHYTPYPRCLDTLKQEYHIETEYYGNSDHGSTKTVFTRKTQEEIEQEKLDKDLQYQIKQLEQKFNIKISYENK